MTRTTSSSWHRLPLLLTPIILLAACERRAQSPAAAAALPDEPSPTFRNVATPTTYVGDSACANCHAQETTAYRQHAMSETFHQWTAATRVEKPLAAPIVHDATGFSYSVDESGGQLYQTEFLTGPNGKRLHELKRRMDYVTGSGNVARTYFTAENGRLFQLPLTWYSEHGWDFSPGYRVNNARFDRVMPDRCIACHSSYPDPLPFAEGKYTEVRPGIGCERCHGPGALHVKERTAGAKPDSAYDNTIVNPARLPLARRMDICEQCHVHTAVSVLREGRDEFSYLPSQPLRDQWAFFKQAGSIDIVSHADRLRQSACFLATRTTARPLECATCHDPHQPPPAAGSRNLVCQTCHRPDSLARRLTRSASLADHAPDADCVSCHMPKVGERGVPHGTFTDHWIRVTQPGAPPPTVPRTGNSPIEPFFDRDKTGPDAAIYQGMGGIVYATLATSTGALAAAAATLDKALGADTTRGEAHFLLGVAYGQLGKTPEAIRALERAVRIDSGRPDRLRALAQAYERAGRDPATVDYLYRRALSLQPALAWLRADYADFLQGEGRRDEAIRAYRAALAEQPSLATGWFDLGAVLAASHETRPSADAFQRAVDLDPSLGEALSRLMEVRTSGGSVTGVRQLPPPLDSLAIRDRGPRAIQMSAQGTALRIFNVPPRSLVQIQKPDGTLIHALTPVDGWALEWNLTTDGGAPVAAGLYRAQVTGRDPTGRPFSPQLVYFGVVRGDGSQQGGSRGQSP
jgi:Tfp pilus assembly protein PilF